MEEFTTTRVQIGEKLAEFSTKSAAQTGIEQWLAVKGCGPLEIKQIMNDLNSYPEWEALA